MLDHAKVGAADYVSAGERRLSGLYQAITSARSVTFALQTMSGHVDGFDEWYAGVQTRLKEDPICRWSVNLRNRMEKRGDHGQGTVTTHISYLDSSMIAQMNQHAPPGTTSMFLGDSLGRNGWVVALPDGTEQTVYFTPPPTVTTSFQLVDGPEHGDVAELLNHLLSILADVVAEAEQRFLAHDVI